FQLIPHDTHLGVHYAVGYEYLRCGLPPLRLVPCSAHKKKRENIALFLLEMRHTTILHSFKTYIFD
ncbi:MAG: hypothetical protein LBE09_01995, partial [Christensenellaceae bacterium]|nr:hypothetical protein [Christensenellaceae bacterium]